MKDSKIGWFIFSAAVVIMFALLTAIPGNAIYNAPALNKIIGFTLLALTVPVGLSLAHDWISFSSNDKLNNWIHLGIIAVLAVLGLCTLVVWHSGPLGTVTNNL
jgi:ABC-type amino acid transport system permease subunit